MTGSIGVVSIGGEDTGGISLAGGVSLCSWSSLVADNGSGVGTLTVSVGKSPLPSLDAFIHAKLANRQGVQGAIQGWSIDCNDQGLSRCITYQMSRNRWCKSVLQSHSSKMVVGYGSEEGRSVGRDLMMVGSESEGGNGRAWIGCRFSSIAGATPS